MNTKQTNSVLIAAIAAFSAILGFGGCASTPPASAEQTLLSAGFRIRTPSTPRQKEIFATLPAYQVHKLTAKGQTYYVYKDQGKGVAFVGREAEYQRYRQFVRRDNAAAGDDRAMEMEQATAESWSSEYALDNDWR
jgi:hypothetical protein